MESNNTHLHSFQSQPITSGLLRFRSAPSSLLSNFTASDSSESERLLSRFVSYCDNSSNSASPSFREFEEKPSLNSMNSQQGYNSGLPPHYPRHGSVTTTTTTSSSAMDGGSFGMLESSMGMDQEMQQKSFSPNLLRQSSSPAGLFNNNISFQNGYAAMKSVGNYVGVNGSVNGELTPSINKLKNQISFSSRSASSLGMLSQISEEIGSEGIEAANNPDDRRHVGSDDDAPNYGSAIFPYGSWNDTPSHLSGNLSGLKRARDSNVKLYCGAQSGELGNQVQILSHHLSLPKASAEMFAMEKFLQFPDSVPCKIRAKRGCATHPRSIAERVRRTRISERMRKLQELVPHMDKQTNTADMLDLAVEYIKDLQKQFKTLTDKSANCKCISMRKTDTNQIA